MRKRERRRRYKKKSKWRNNLPGENYVRYRYRYCTVLKGKQRITTKPIAKMRRGGFTSAEASEKAKEDGKIQEQGEGRVRDK